MIGFIINGKSSVLKLLVLPCYQRLLKIPHRSINRLTSTYPDAEIYDFGAIMSDMPLNPTS
jgi:hypothetical protein